MGSPTVTFRQREASGHVDHGRERERNLRHLITGGAGFIGSHLADGLVARGDEVLDPRRPQHRHAREHRASARRRRGRGWSTASTHDAAVVDELMASADTCFHLASAVGVKLIVEQPARRRCLRNVRGSRHGDGGGRRASARRLLFASTSEVYGKHSDGALREDADRLLGAPRSRAGPTRRRRRSARCSPTATSRERGAQMTVVAGCSTRSARARPAPTGWCCRGSCARRSPGDDLTVYGDGTQSRCFTHVYDAVDALVLADRGGRGRSAASTTSARAESVTIIELARASDRAHRLAARSSASSPTSRRTARASRSSGGGGRTARRSSSLTGWRPRRTIDDAIDDAIAWERRDARAVARAAALGLCPRAHVLPRTCGSRSRAERILGALGLSRVRVLRVIARLNLGGPAQQAALLSGRRLDPSRYETLLVHGSLAAGEESMADLAQREGARTEFLPSLGQPPRPDLDADRAGADRRRSPGAFARMWSTPTRRRRASSGGSRALAALRPRPVIVHTYHGHVLEGYFGPRGSRVYRKLETAARPRAATASSGSARRPSMTSCGSASRRGIASA